MHVHVHVDVHICARVHAHVDVHKYVHAHAHVDVQLVSRGQGPWTTQSAGQPPTTCLLALGLASVAAPLSLLSLNFCQLQVQVEVQAEISCFNLCRSWTMCLGTTQGGAQFRLGRGRPNAYCDLWLIYANTNLVW